MYDKLNTLLKAPSIDCKDKGQNEKFDQWMMKSNLLQIRLVTALTGVLYIGSALMNSLIVKGDILELMLLIHLYLMPPLLFLLTLMTYKKELYTYLIILLIIAPLFATIGNLVITLHMHAPALYMTELYLIIFWIFTVSGLRLWQATLSASMIVVVMVMVVYWFFALSVEAFVMHCFWILSAYSFGFLAAYLLEKSYKEVFSTHEKLTQLAMTDTLTGLHNRAKLDELLKNELTRAKHFKHTFAVAIMDIDYFKHVNDSHGHQVGDSILREIGALITEKLATLDKVIRWGGEEFLLIYIETDKEAVLQQIEALRLHIQAHAFSISDEITASFGLTLNQQNDTIDSIIQRADKALYAAKNNGRNCVVCY